MRKTLFVKSLLISLSLMLTMGIAANAEEKPKATVDFICSETADGLVELEVKVKNTTFNILQTAIRYNKDVLSPIESEDASGFDGFAVPSEESMIFDRVGCTVEKDKGLFGFTVYIMPIKSGENIDETGRMYVAGENGVSLYKFYFEKISEGDYSFEIARKDETKPYQPAFKDGIAVLSSIYNALDTDVTFSYQGKESETITYVPIPPKAPQTLTSEERKKDVICLRVGRNLSVVHGKKKYIDPDNQQVVPYVKNDRTMVPLRFVAEALGAEVLWEEGKNGCTINKDSKNIQITFGSNEFVVDGKTVTYDAPIEVTHDRTMVPVRFVSEEFGCDVYWNQTNSAVVIAPAENPWVADRKAEITALTEMLVTMLGIF